MRNYKSLNTFIVIIKNKFTYYRIIKIRYFSDLHLEFIKPNKIEKFIKEYYLVLMKYVY
jgi:hypothetical protein